MDIGATRVKKFWQGATYKTMNLKYPIEGHPTIPYGLTYNHNTF